MQETWLSSESDTSLFELHGYNFVSVGKFCSAHSGLGIYISDDYNFKVMNMHEQSMLWDGMFVEISGQSLNDKKIMLGNIYRPPRNIIDDYNTFFSELVPILTQLNKSKTEVVIAGDFNLDLLKLNENNIVSNFFEIITSQMFHPTITLPTRFSDKRCALIDNFYCKYSPAIMNSTTGILTNNISDHQPYILNIHNLTTKVNVKKYVKLNPQNSNSLINFKTEIQKANIYNTLNKDEGYDPNENYGIMQEIINNQITTYFPVRVVKFNKRKHKKSNWITKGIINSISFRDNMYRKLKQTSHDSQHFETLKINLRTYNKILKRNIKQAKKAYYQEAFQKHQNDIKSTWRIIKDISIIKLEGQLFRTGRRISPKFCTHVRI